MGFQCSTSSIRPRRPIGSTSQITMRRRESTRNKIKSKNDNATQQSLMSNVSLGRGHRGFCIILVNISCFQTNPCTPIYWRLSEKKKKKKKKKKEGKIRGNRLRNQVTRLKNK